jgi:pyridoxal phosphate enzyme (YggS family)
LNFKENMAKVESRILEACRRSGRSREEIEIVAVTKYGSADQVKQVLDAGLTHIGENRWQDAKAKWEQFGAQGTWHFIGHLQSNKVKDVAGKFTYIHSLDRMSLAKELEKKAEEYNLRQNCFIQVNVSGEDTKYGLAPGQLHHFARQIRDMEHIHIVGLMTMAPHEEEPENTRPVFRGLRELRDRLNDEQIFDYPVRHLSMGMSNDFEIAVEEGATWLRLGSVLFGRD